MLILRKYYLNHTLSIVDIQYHLKSKKQNKKKTKKQKQKNKTKQNKTKKKNQKTQRLSSRLKRQSKSSIIFNLVLEVNSLKQISKTQI